MVIVVYGNGTWDFYDEATPERRRFPHTLVSLDKCALKYLTTVEQKACLEAVDEMEKRRNAIYAS